MTQPELPLPDNCRVRLVDLPVTAGGMIAVDETGFINIYINARLSRDAQREALQHELRHHYRGDLYSDRDIRAVEAAETDAPGLCAIDGEPLADRTAAFEPEELRRVGEGLYLPTGENRARAAAHIDALRRRLADACGIYDVMQTPPLLSVDDLRRRAGALRAGDIAFIAWQNLDGRSRAMLHFSREGLYGAIYYASDGSPDNALAVICLDGARVIVDLRRRGNGLDVWRITREIGGRVEKVY